MYKKNNLWTIYSVRIIFKVTRQVAIVPGLKRHKTYKQKNEGNVISHRA